MKREIIGATAIMVGVVVGTLLIAYGALLQNSSFTGTGVLIAVVGGVLGALLLIKRGQK